jgi:hypothetical protein
MHLSLVRDWMKCDGEFAVSTDTYQKRRESLDGSTDPDLQAVADPNPLAGQIGN